MLALCCSPHIWKPFLSLLLEVVTPYLIELDASARKRVAISNVVRLHTYSEGCGAIPLHPSYYIHPITSTQPEWGPNYLHARENMWVGLWYC